MERPQLVYAATPSRLEKHDPQVVGRIEKYISSRNQLPFHPFSAFPYEYFEGNSHLGLTPQELRKIAMKPCFDAVKMSRKFWLFGISDGTLQEARVALNFNRKPWNLFRRKQIEFHLDWDPDWQKWTEKLAHENPQHKKTLRRLGLFPGPERTF